MSSDFPSVLTSISLNFLRKLGNKTSTVFSTISVALGLTDYSLDSGEPLPAEISDGAPDFDLGEFKEKLESLKEKMESNYLSSTLWRFPFSVHQEKPFFDNENNSKNATFISMDYDENFKISCDQDVNKWAEDEDFKVLYIPMAGSSCLSFVIFFPKSTDIGVLESLDAEKFPRLLNELSPTFIDFEIPTFTVHSDLQIGEILGLDTGISTQRVFEVKDEVGESDENCRIISKRSTGIIKPPCETNPIKFQANRPFLFIVLNENVPLVMGVFCGK